MSAEKIINSTVNNVSSSEATYEIKGISPSGRVDINILLNRARKVKAKENLTNFIFLGMILSLILIVGIILSF
tara:strand:- start:43 stop:261 length:219 start_codon:yes stop_codon:yes gene_type:complete